MTIALWEATAPSFSRDAYVLEPYVVSFAFPSVACPAIFLITEAKMPQKLIPNHRTINSKQLLKNNKRKANLKGKRKMAGWSDEFLAELLDAPWQNDGIK